MKKLFFSLAVIALLMTGCSKDEYLPQLPQAVIENLSAVTAVAQGEVVTLKANITSALATTITWSVDEQVVTDATALTFDFSSDQSGDHIIKLTVENQDGKVTDQITITVYYLIDFEAPRVADYLAIDIAGTNLYSSYGAGQYIGYDDPCGLYMMINEADPYGMGMSREFWNGGIAISQWKDMTTEGSSNQCSVYYNDATTGFGGYKGSRTFAVVTGYDGAEYPYGADTRPIITFDDGATECAFDHFWVTNSTYAALSMKNGDDYAKIFSYADNDWFKLVITAYDKNDNQTGTAVEFYLADFRTATSPGIITEWKKVDLKPLGNKVHTVKFDLQSSDVGAYGMNTPGYFCFDNLAIIR